MRAAYLAGMSTQSALARIALLALAASLAVSPVAAQAQDQPDWADDAFEQAESMVSTYNENVEKGDLGPAGPQLKGEVVNLHVEAEDGETAAFSFEMNDDYEIEDLQQGTDDNATIEMTTDRETVQSIASSENPPAAFKRAVTRGEIDIGGIGLVNGAKWGAINAAADVARGIGGLF